MHSFLRATVLFSVLSGNLSDAFSPVYTRKSTAIRQLYMSDIVGSNEGVDRNGQQNLMNRGLMEEELLQGDQQSFLEMASEDDRQDALDRQKKLVKERKKLMKNSGGGGFGAASKGKKPSGHTEFNARVDKDGFGAVVMEEGVARVNGCMSIETSQNLLAFVNQQLLDSIDEVSNGEADEISRFADVLEKRNGGICFYLWKKATK